VDDKGQVFMHMTANEAHLSQTGALPVNIKVILEGEEEVGSANLDDFIKANKDLLKADVVVISDSPMFDRDVPSICYGLRGLAYFQIDVRGTKSDCTRVPSAARGQSGDGAGDGDRRHEGQERPHQDSRLLRRCRGAAR
jgi:acetylornithine deacetylase/succinyl-diaminopimelate desuccinylase-like protein